MGEKRKIGFNVRCGTFFTDLCNTIDKTDKKPAYLLFSRKSSRRRREFKGVISNNTLKKYICRGQEVVFHLQWILRSNSNAYSIGGSVRCCEEGSRRKLLDIMNVFERFLIKDPTTKFHEGAKLGYEADYVLQLIYITIIPAILNLHLQKSSKQ